MAIVALMDSKLPAMIRTGLYSDLQMEVLESFFPGLIDAIITGTTELLGAVKSKDKPVVLKFEQVLPNGDNSQNFIAAAMIQYFPGEDGNPGNWNYSWTFDKEDVPEDAVVLSIFDSQYASFYRTVSHTKYGIIFDNNEYMGQIFCYILKTIKNYLNENASEAEEWGIKLDGIAQFRVAVEDGEKVLSIEVDGEIKQLIKDDAAIEV